MAKELQILVACGSGVATSTVAVGMVQDILGREGISAKLHKCSLGELDSRQAGMDLILTTSNYKKPLDVAHMSVFALISGVNAEAAEARLVDLCRSLQA